MDKRESASDDGNTADKWPSLLHRAAKSRQADEGEGQRVGTPLKNSGSFEGRRGEGAQRTPILFGQ